MKWKEFIELSKKAGIKDEDDIAWIDIHLPDELWICKGELGWSIS